MILAVIHIICTLPRRLAMSSGTITLRPPSGRGNPKAVDVLEDDWERMVAFYDFPEDHWKHLRTTNVVESPFAALRLRTRRQRSASSGSRALRR